MNKYLNGIALSLIALVAAFWQTAEKIHILANPSDPIACNINPVVDCGSVLNHSLSSVFGVSNSIIGIVMFAMIFTLFVAKYARTKFSKVMDKIFLSLLTIALLFSLWFFAVSLYIIGKICIFCIAIWFGSVSMFFMFAPELVNKKSKIIEQVKQNRFGFIALTFITMLALFLFEFRDYYF